MRLKKGKTNYGLPLNITDIQQVGVRVRGVTYALMRVNRKWIENYINNPDKRDCPIAFWWNQDKGEIVIVPAPVKAWQLIVVASKLIIL